MLFALYIMREMIDYLKVNRLFVMDWNYHLNIGKKGLILKLVD